MGCVPEVRPYFTVFLTAAYKFSFSKGKLRHRDAETCLSRWGVVACLLSPGNFLAASPSATRLKGTRTSGDKVTVVVLIQGDRDATATLKQPPPSQLILCLCLSSPLAAHSPPRLLCYYKL